MLLRAQVNPIDQFRPVYQVNPFNQIRLMYQVYPFDQVYRVYQYHSVNQVNPERVSSVTERLALFSIKILPWKRFFLKKNIFFVWSFSFVRWRQFSFSLTISFVSLHVLVYKYCRFQTILPRIVNHWNNSFSEIETILSIETNWNISSIATILSPILIHYPFSNNSFYDSHSSSCWFLYLNLCFIDR